MPDTLTDITNHAATTIVAYVRGEATMADCRAAHDAYRDAMGVTPTASLADIIRAEHDAQALEDLNLRRCPNAALLPIFTETEDL